MDDIKRPSWQGSGRVSRGDLLLVRVAALWLIGATFGLAFAAWTASFCFVRCEEPPPVPIGLVPLGFATWALSRTAGSVPLLVLPAAIGVITGVGLTILGTWAEVAATFSDPYGPSPGTYFTGHGSQLAVMSVVLLAVPAAAILIGARGSRHSLRWRFGWPMEVGLIGVLVGAVIGTLPGTVPTIRSSERSFVSTRHSYNVILPAGYEASRKRCLFLGTCWTLPEAIDWFAEVDEVSSEIQLSVWSTPLSADATLAALAAVQQTSDDSMGFAATGAPSVARIAGAEAIRLTYRAEVAPRSLQSACILGMACDEIAVWSDCRFYLMHEGREVRAERIISVVGGRGFVISAFTSPDAFDQARRLLDVFAAAIQPDRSTLASVADEMEPYPESGPLTANKKSC